MRDGSVRQKSPLQVLGWRLFPIWLVSRKFGEEQLFWHWAKDPKYFPLPKRRTFLEEESNCANVRPRKIKNGPFSGDTVSSVRVRGLDKNVRPPLHPSYVIVVTGPGASRKIGPRSQARAGTGRPRPGKTKPQCAT